MAKRKTKRKASSKKSTHFLLYIILFLSSVIVAVAIFIAGYYTGYHSAEKKIQSHHYTQESQSGSHKVVSKIPKYKPEIKKQLKEVLEKESKAYNTASHEIDDDTLANPPKIPPLKKPISSSKEKVLNGKPKLAIIIDDTSTASQVRAIKSLHIPITMSFLPPSKARPHSAQLAAKESFYMVHLPMEALHFNAEEPYTMRVNDSQEKILQRVKEIKKLFPRVHYINNHTGSKFTSNEKAMEKLIYAFNKYNILFVDSRTIGKTKAPKVLKALGMRYVSRDIFLDHHPDKIYIKGQIRKAVALAKRKGIAIAIGHPHKATLQALYESKDLLKQVDLVQINQIY